MDSIETDKTYKKYKVLVKNWEKEFKAKHCRVPSKCDIKEAPTKVKYAYKKYFNLKSAALENSLDIYEVNETVIDSPESSFCFDAIHLETPSPKSENLMKSLPSASELNLLLSNESFIKNQDIANKLNPSDDHTQSKIENVNNTNILVPVSDNLSQKLSQFSNVRKSLRNPRKSLVKCQQKLECRRQDENSTALKIDIQFGDKLDTVLDIVPIKVAESYSSNSQLIINTVHSNENIKTNVRKINDGWLERASGICIKDNVLSSVSEKFGIKNINMTNFSEISQTDKLLCEYIENSESDEDTISEKNKPASKKRKLTVNQQTLDTRKSEKIESDSKVKSDCSIKKSNKVVEGKNEDANPPDFDQFITLGLERDLLPRYSKSSKVKEEIGVKKNITKKNLHPADKLEQKIKSGTLNDNYVKINIEKKVYVRGKKNINFSKYKKQQWKKKKALNGGMEFPDSGKIACFKCGDIGHMARYCTAHRGDSLLPINAVDDNNIPTLDEMSNKNKDNDANIDQFIDSTIELSTYKPSVVPESFLSLLSNNNDNENSQHIKPVYSDFNAVNVQEIYEALHLFGHTSFRFGQEEAVKRILCGYSTLLLLSTGCGKSLCYQLPAYIYSKHFKCITLVISPLVSLMEDQIISMPDYLKAGCLHTNQSQSQRRKIMQLIKDGQLNILLISPEALISGDSSNGFQGLFKSLPPIAFACIDEAHCVSQWSHNFRPSYLMICRVLQEKLNVKCILGLTATASQTTVKSIINHINITDDFNGVISNPDLPTNLILSVSQERDKDRALLSFLSSTPISSYNSVIVYCIRRDECERVASILRSSLQEVGKTIMEKRNKKRKQMSFIAEAYHAGMSAAQRKKIQSNFMSGNLRIIVATVAFGMGINKSDIRCIIHYDMPSSFESYVQEVGRAGRDGEQAHCHVFVSSNKNDKNELLKHIHSNSIDRNIIRKLLQKVFVPCECNSLKKISESEDIKCKGHEVAIPIDETVEELDLAAENIATLLCYLELHPKNIIKVLNNTYTMCKIFSYGGAEKLNQAALKCAPLAMALRLKKGNNKNNFSNIEFPVVEVAAELGWESGITKYHLKNLEWKRENESYRRSEFKVEFHTLGFRIRAPGDLTPEELDKMLDYLHNTVLSQEKTMLYQLEEINAAFHEIGATTIQNVDLENKKDMLLKQSNILKTVIRDYFQRDNIIPLNVNLEARPLDEERVIGDVRALITSYKDCNFTGRSIAKILQGISSPNYPAIVWGRCKFWRSHMGEDFNGLVRIATQQIIAMKLK